MSSELLYNGTLSEVHLILERPFNEGVLSYISATQNAFYWTGMSLWLFAINFTHAHNHSHIYVSVDRLTETLQVPLNHWELCYTINHYELCAYSVICLPRNVHLESCYRAPVCQWPIYTILFDLER